MSWQALSINKLAEELLPVIKAKKEKSEEVDVRVRDVIFSSLMKCKRLENSATTLTHQLVRVALEKTNGNILSALEKQRVFLLLSEIMDTKR